MDFKFFRVGKIVNTHGLNGEVKIFLHTDFAEARFEKGNYLFIGEKANSTNLEVEIVYSRPYKDMYILKFKDLNTINDVEKYKNLFLWVPTEQQIDLDNNEFYYFEIIGCNVVTLDGLEIGVVKEILSPGANDVWVVKSKLSDKEIFIPYIESVVKDVDVQNKRITIELMEGLIE
ncbi:MAG: ribosome maturation factor RimM [Vulcanibacillus sp.]